VSSDVALPRLPTAVVSPVRRQRGGQCDLPATMCRKKSGKSAHNPHKAAACHRPVRRQGRGSHLERPDGRRRAEWRHNSQTAKGATWLACSRRAPAVTASCVQLASAAARALSRQQCQARRQFGWQHGDAHTTCPASAVAAGSRQQDGARRAKKRKTQKGGWDELLGSWRGPAQKALRAKEAKTSRAPGAAEEDDQICRQTLPKWLKQQRQRWDGKEEEEEAEEAVEEERAEEEQVSAAAATSVTLSLPHFSLCFSDPHYGNSSNAEPCASCAVLCCAKMHRPGRLAPDSRQSTWLACAAPAIALQCGVARRS